MDECARCGGASCRGAKIRPICEECLPPIQREDGWQCGAAPRDEPRRPHPVVYPAEPSAGPSQAWLPDTVIERLYQSALNGSFDDNVVMLTAFEASAIRNRVSRSTAPEHRCGVRGFDGMKGDVCPVCRAGSTALPKETE